MSHARNYSLSRSVITAAFEPTPEVIEVSLNFGIGLDDRQEVQLYKDLPVRLGPGRILYFTGESGAGKTSALRDVAAAAAADFEVIPTPDAFEDRPVVNLFATFEEGMTLLSYCGLSEAFVMLRRPRELSDGQRYRLMLAVMMSRARKTEKTPLIVVDEFLAYLDRETARGVARQVRKAVTKGALCLACASTHSDIVADLQPDTTYRMALHRDTTVEKRSPL